SEPGLDRSSGSDAPSFMALGPRPENQMSVPGYASVCGCTNGKLWLLPSAWPRCDQMHHPAFFSVIRPYTARHKTLERRFDRGTRMWDMSAAFPETQWSQLIQLHDPASPRRQEILEGLAFRYWKPVYHYIRVLRPISAVDAEDLTQQFFTTLLQRGDF